MNIHARGGTDRRYLPPGYRYAIAITASRTRYTMNAATSFFSLGLRYEQVVYGRQDEGRRGSWRCLLCAAANYYISLAASCNLSSRLRATTYGVWAAPPSCRMHDIPCRNNAFCQAGKCRQPSTRLDLACLAEGSMFDWFRFCYGSRLFFDVPVTSDLSFRVSVTALSRLCALQHLLFHCYLLSRRLHCHFFHIPALSRCLGGSSVMWTPPPATRRRLCLRRGYDPLPAYHSYRPYRILYHPVIPG